MKILPRYFLAYFSTLTAVGLFAIADKIANIIEMLKVSFNKRGFMKLEEYEMQDGELEQEQLEEDEYMPARA